jgi:hypothetical protein
MIDKTSTKLIIGFIGLLILGFIGLALSALAG